MHTDFACLLSRHMKPGRRASAERAEEIMRSGVETEKSFICGAVPCSLIGMNKGLMGQYIEFVADRLMVQLGYAKIYDAKNPFPFMERICMISKKNFFEKDVASTARPSSTPTKARTCLRSTRPSNDILTTCTTEDTKIATSLPSFFGGVMGQHRMGTLLCCITQEPASPSFDPLDIYSLPPPPPSYGASSPIPIRPSRSERYGTSEDPVPASDDFGTSPSSTSARRTCGRFIFKRGRAPTE